VVDQAWAKATGLVAAQGMSIEALAVIVALLIWMVWVWDSEEPTSC
jgi:hypothetical protein